MKFLKTVVIFFLFSHFIFSQKIIERDTLQAAQYFKKAESLLADRKLDSSIIYFEKALPLYENAKAWERVAGCYNGISENMWRTRKYDTSISKAKEALKVHVTHIKKPNKEEAYVYDNLGNCFEKTASFEKAIEHYQKALQIRKKIFNEDHIDLSISYDYLGLLHRKLGDYNLALRFLEKSRNIKIREYGENHYKVADTFYDFAGLLFSKGEYDRAIEYIEKALDIKTNHYGKTFPGISNYYNGLGLLHHEKGDYSKAIEYIQEAIKLHKQNVGDNHPRVLVFYNNIGNSFNMNGEHQKALSFLKKAVDIGVRMTGENNLNIVMALHNVAMIYNAIDNTKEALYYNNRALNIGEKILGKDHFNLIPAYRLNGVLYGKQKRFSESFEYLEKVLTISKKSLGEYHTTVADCYSSLGHLFFLTEEHEKSLQYHEKSLNILINLFGNNSSFIALKYNTIADLYFSKEDYKKAIVNYKKAERANTKINELNTNAYFNLITLLNSWEGISSSYQKLYKKTGIPENLTESISFSSKNDSLINNIRVNLSNYQDKLTFSKKVKEIYNGAIESRLLLYKHTNNENVELLNQGFLYSEKSKSNTLKEILNNSNAKGFSGLSSDLIVLEKNVRIDKAFFQSKINKEFSKKNLDSVKLIQYESKLFDISRKQDSLTKVLEKNYPKYYQLKYDNEVISVARIQQKLDDKTTFLEFFTADSITYAFTISKNNIAVKELSTPKLEEQVKEFQSAITKDYEAYKEISYKLYQALVAPIRKELVGNQLIIVPDGPLWYLNFDLLLTGENVSNNPTDWPYLLRDYAISYANSATLLFRNSLEQDSNSKALQECLAFSFSGEENTEIASSKVRLRSLRSAGRDLPGTREEINAIANIVDGQYFYGSEATEQNFKQHAGAYSILHLAMHGEVDNERPENSKLYFTKSRDTLEDNYLYSHELFALDIPAELTVLSACNTGTGKIAKGEGIMSLGNAFQYAGTKSLLLTNWEVSDETTPNIMEYFYRNLKDGKNKAEALQQAKLQFLNTTNEETNHPYYWGGFYLLGDTAVIELKNDSSKYWWIGFGVLALILVSLFWYRKKNALISGQA